MTGQVRVIAIVGGSGVGKSSLTRTLAERLRPETVAMLSEDDYYKEFSHSPDFDPAQCNFDEPSAKDHPRLVHDLKRLRGGEAIVRPAYAFATHSRRPRGVRVQSAEVVILEGQHLLCDADLRALIDLAVYLDVDADLRFIRRLRRDMMHRRRSVESIVQQYLRHVRPSHDLHVEPSRAHADLVLRESPDAEMSSQHQIWSNQIIGALLAGEGERQCTG